MISEEPSSPPVTPARPPDAVEPEPLRVADWLREPVTERALTRGERLRLGWEQHAGKVLGGTAAFVTLTLVAVLTWQGINLARGESNSRPVDGSGNALGPFAGTPAETFAVGEAGIALPTARAAAPFTAQQVADALTKVRQALIHGRLERSMLAGDPTKFVALLTPDGRYQVDKDFAAGDSLAYATRIDPAADPRFDPAPGIRVSGSMEYRLVTDDRVRELEITTRFLWVYSFALPGRQAHPPGTGLVTLRDEVVWQVPHPDDVLASSAGLWLASADYSVLNATCAAILRGMIDLEIGFERGLPAGSTKSIYDPNWGPEEAEIC
ncbi:hypothetical protein ACGFH8_33385 [Micromonospora sp. NPDC049175]|uniref:hypothetical protein n=1 Tax=Micromonospora sp. NPDC049175 TaxID=3364266 RepID=UPI00371DB581